MIIYISRGEGVDLPAVINALGLEILCDIEAIVDLVGLGVREYDWQLVLAVEEVCLLVDIPALINVIFPHICGGVRKHWAHEHNYYRFGSVPSP